MLKLIWFILSIFLIILVLLRMPKESVGLSSFAAKPNSLGFSPSSVERLLNILTIFGILIYFGNAIEFNLK